MNTLPHICYSHYLKKILQISIIIPPINILVKKKIDINDNLD